MVWGRTHESHALKITYSTTSTTAAISVAIYMAAGIEKDTRKLTVYVLANFIRDARLRNNYHLEQEIKYYVYCIRTLSSLSIIIIILYYHVICMYYRLYLPWCVSQYIIKAIEHGVPCSEKVVI